MFSYGAKGVRDIDPTCRCHQSNIIPGSIFSVKITLCNLWLNLLDFLFLCGCFFVFLFVCLWVCVSVCVLLGMIFWAPFIHRDKVPSFSLLH